MTPADLARFATAVHEAGHVVAALRMGIPIAAVEAKPPKPFLPGMYRSGAGHATWASPDLKRPDFCWLVAYMAGELSAEAFGFRQLLVVGESVDRKAIAHHAARLPVGALADAKIEATNIVKRDEKAIACLARILERVGRLEGDELAAAIIGCMGGPPETLSLLDR
jgi:hypothetical protein